MCILNPREVWLDEDLYCYKDVRPTESPKTFLSRYLPSYRSSWPGFSGFTKRYTLGTVKHDKTGAGFYMYRYPRAARPSASQYDQSAELLIRILPHQSILVGVSPSTNDEVVAAKAIEVLCIVRRWHKRSDHGLRT